MFLDAISKAQHVVCIPLYTIPIKKYCVLHRIKRIAIRLTFIEKMEMLAHIYNTQFFTSYWLRLLILQFFQWDNRMI